MPNVALIGPWWKSLDEANEKYFPLSPGGNGRWENIKAVSNIIEALYNHAG